MKSDLLRANQNPENKIEPEQLRKALVEYPLLSGASRHTWITACRGHPDCRPVERRVKSESRRLVLLLRDRVWDRRGDGEGVPQSPGSRRAGPSLGQKICCAGNRWRAALGGCRCLSMACGHIPSGLGNIRPGGHERRNNGLSYSHEVSIPPVHTSGVYPLDRQVLLRGEPYPDYYGVPVGCIYGVPPVVRP